MVGSSSEPVLTYFNIPGRAEAIRLALTIGGVPFKDQRISFEQWPELKPTTPFGALPILEVDGSIIAQSVAILTFAGRRANLIPSDPILEAKVFMILGAVEDCFTMIAAYNMEPDQAAKKGMEQKFAPILAKNFAKIEAALAANVAAHGWAVGSALSIADLQLYVIALMLGAIQPILPSDFDAKVTMPSVMKIFESVKKNEKVAAWNASHAA